MSIDTNGSAIRDIDELRISYGEHFGKVIVLTKDKITYRNAISPTVAYMSFPDGYFDWKTIEITYEQFKSLSELIHNSGLFNLFKLQSESVIYPGAIYQSLHCVFDDGTQGDYITRFTPPKEYDQIAKILSSFCGLDQFNGLIQNETTNDTERHTYITKCCYSIAFDGWKFCPKCGKPAERANDKEANEDYDFNETMWMCESCGEGIPLIYKYCGNCGSKRTW